MNGQKQAKANGENLTPTHNDLQQVTEDELKTEGARIVADATQGKQTAIISSTGKVRAVVGINCVRYLPDPDTDPLQEFLLSVLDSKTQSER